MSDMCAVHDSYRCTIHAPWCADCVRHCQYASFDGVEGDCRFPKPALAEFEASDIEVVTMRRGLRHPGCNYDAALFPPGFWHCNKCGFMEADDEA